MKKKLISKFLICFTVPGMIFTGCSKDDGSDANLSGEITTIEVNGLIGDEIPESRAHWDDKTGKLLFHWDSSTDEMMASVVGTSGFKAFAGGKKVSGINVSAFSGEEYRLKANLFVQDKLAVDYENGDKFYAFLPVQEGASSVFADGKNVVFNMSVPLKLKQSASDNTAHISKYAYMVGEGDVSVYGGYAFTEVGFNVLPTLFCFNVTNKSFDKLEIKGVSIEGNINNSAAFVIDKPVSVQYSGAKNTQKFEVTADGLSIEKDASTVVYGLAFPTKIEAGSKIIFGFNGIYDGGKVYNVEKTITFDKAMNFESNHFQTFDMNISVTGIDVSWDVTSWGQITEKPVTGTSSTINTGGVADDWGTMTDNSVNGGTANAGSEGSVGDWGQEENQDVPAEIKEYDNN